MKRPKLYYLFVAISSLLTSCSALIGIRSPKKLPDESISKISSELGIPSSNSYKIEKEFINYLFKLDTAKFKTQIKNHYQPLQALYFDKNGNLVKFYVNCYAGGMPLNWNRDAGLENFLPKDQAPIDTILSLQRQISFLKPITNSSEINSLASANADYFIFVYWNKFMYRHSKRLIKFIKYNYTKAQDKTVKLIFVNNDNMFVGKM